MLHICCSIPNLLVMNKQSAIIFELGGTLFCPTFP